MVCKKRVESIFDIPTIDQIQNSKNALGEDDDRLKCAEEVISNWITSEAHLPKNYEQNIIRNFLRGAKHDIEKAKAKLESYFYTRHACPEFYSNWDPSLPEIAALAKSVNIAFLPKLTKNGARIVYFSVEDSDAETFDVEALGKLLLMLYESCLMTETPVSGEILIFELSKLSGNHLIKLLSPAFKNLLNIFKDSYCVRIQEIHIVNAPSFIEKLMLIVKPLCHPKIKNRFIIHKNENTLLNHLPTEVLPGDFGGDLDKVRTIVKKWHHILIENAEWLKNCEDIKTEKPPKKYEQQFQNNIGVTGTFRKLNID